MSIESLLALPEKLLAGTTDGRILAWPISKKGVGPTVELCKVDAPVVAMTFVDGAVLAAVGPRLLHVSDDGSTSQLLECDAPISALTARGGRAYVLAGAHLHVIEKKQLVSVVVMPTKDASDLDIDRKGKRAVVVEQPHRGWVVDLVTGKELGKFHPAQWLAKRTRETNARFSPVSDHLYVARSGAHQIAKCSFKGRSVEELSQSPSTWCTPLATTEDGRFLASRQSGVGVAVWDLEDASRELFLFAELDADTDDQAKFDKRAAVTPAAVKELGSGSITVTRWRRTPEREGQATAIAIAPRCAYLATGDRDDRVTVVDVETRRIERSDGAVIQPACLHQSVAMPDPVDSRSVRFGDELVYVTKSGEVGALDLASGERIRRGEIELRSPFDVFAHGDDLVVVVDDKRARCFARAITSCTWSFEDPLPGCERVTFDGRFLIGMRGQELHRFDPVARKPLASVRVKKGRADVDVKELGVSGGGGRCFVDGWDSDGRHRTFPLDEHGNLGEPLPYESTLLPGFEHVLVQDIHGWAIFRVDDLERPPLHEAKVEDLVLGITTVDLVRGRVASRALHTQRVYVFTLDGAHLANLDALGSVRDFAFGPSADSLWTFERHGMARRFSLSK